MNFDPLAHYYDWMEWVLAGRLLQRARVRWLQDLAGCRNVLSVGEGHGRFAAAFVRAFPRSRLTCIDDSAGMLARAQRRVQRVDAARDRVSWIQTSLPGWSPPTERFDGIVTHFFLDCFRPDALGELIRWLSAAAAADATWLISDFSVPPAGWKRWRARAIHRLMYWFFAVVTGIPAREVTDPDEWLTAFGFSRTGREEFDWGLIRADSWVRGAARAVTYPGAGRGLL